MNKIVVGVDGSQGSKRALDWALAEARLQAATLEVVYTYGVPYAYLEASEALPDMEKQLQGEAERLVDDMLTGADVGGVTVERVAESGQPARVLVDRAKDGADLIVVGSRGRGGSPVSCSARSANRSPTTPPARLSSCRLSTNVSAQDTACDDRRSRRGPVAAPVRQPWEFRDSGLEHVEVVCGGVGPGVAAAQHRRQPLPH